MHFTGGDITDTFLNYSALRAKNRDIAKSFHEIGYVDVGDKILDCCKESILRKCTSCGSYHFVDTWNCKSRFCYVCSKKRYLSYIARYMPIFEGYIKKKSKLLLVTWTLRNMNDLELMLNRFNTTFKKFREKYSCFYNNIDGGVISREITNIGNGWHVHFHSILICKDSYSYTDRQYQKILRDNWQTKTGDSWSIHVSSLDQGNLLGAVCETFKYMTKLKLVDSSFLQELYDVTFKRRLLSAFGCMYGKVSETDIEKEIETKDTRDLINLVCAVCGESAISSIVEKFDTDDLSIKSEKIKIYSFKSIVD